MSCSEQSHTTASPSWPSLGGRKGEWEGGRRMAMGTLISCCRKHVQEKTPQGRSEVCHVYERCCIQRNLLLFSSILAKKRTLGCVTAAPWAQKPTSAPQKPCGALRRSMVTSPPGTSTWKHNMRLRESRWPQGLYLEARITEQPAKRTATGCQGPPPALPCPTPYLAGLRHLHPSPPSVTSTLRISFSSAKARGPLSVPLGTGRVKPAHLGLYP